MKSSGITCMVLAGIIFFIIFIIPSTKSSYDTTINFDILFNKLYGILFSTGLLISGAIFTAVGIFYEEQFYEEVDTEENINDISKVYKKELGDGERWCIECGKLISKAESKCGHCGAKYE